MTRVLPVAEIDSGLVWPPLHGRALVREALDGAVVRDHRVVDDDVVITLHGWRLHSPAWFADVETARAQLLAWVKTHTTLLAWLSSRRCVFVGADGAGYRLWQLVGSELSVWQRLAMLEHAEVVDVSTGFAHLCAVCSSVAATWSVAPHPLPCTLETIGAANGVFVGLLPTVERLLEHPTVPVRSSRLIKQMQEFLQSTAGLHELLDVADDG